MCSRGTPAREISLYNGQIQMALPVHGCPTPGDLTFEIDPNHRNGNARAHGNCLRETEFFWHLAAQQGKEQLWSRLCARQNGAEDCSRRANAENGNRPGE